MPSSDVLILLVDYTGLHVKKLHGFFIHFLIDFDVLKPKKIFTTFHHIRFFTIVIFIFLF